MAENHKLYEPIRASLEMLSEEFKRASRMYPPLFHDLLSFGFDGSHRSTTPMIDENEWIAFLEAQRDKNTYLEYWEWNDGEEWHGPHSGQPLYYSTFKDGKRTYVPLPWCGRFHGASNDGLAEFKQLAESLYLVLSQMRTPVPWEEESWVNILFSMHQLALKQPTPLIRV